MRQLKKGMRVCKCGVVNSDAIYRAGCSDCAADLRLSLRRATRQKIKWLEHELIEAARALGIDLNE